MNYVAIFLYAYMIRQPLRDPLGYYPVSRMVPEGIRLPQLPGLDVHAGLLIALALVPIAYYVQQHTPFGFRLKVMEGGLPRSHQAGRVGSFQQVAFAQCGDGSEYLAAWVWR